MFLMCTYFDKIKGIRAFLGLSNTTSRPRAIVKTYLTLFRLKAFTHFDCLHVF